MTGAQHGMCELVRHATAGAEHGICQVALTLQRHGHARKIFAC